MARTVEQIKSDHNSHAATGERAILDILGWLPQAGPAGHAIGLHVTFNWPRYMLQAYPRAWQDIYAREGMVAKDPTVVWGFANTGTARWSELAAFDGGGVLAGAAAHGLRYGCTVALVSAGTRTIGSFARADREFLDAEIAAVASRIADLHRLTQDDTALSPSMRSRLAQLSTRRGT